MEILQSCTRPLIYIWVFSRDIWGEDMQLYDPAVFNWINPSFARIFGENKLNIMVDDALAPWLARSSVATPLTMQDKQALVF